MSTLLINSDKITSWFGKC